jgi:hypothetical protein
VFLGLMVVYSVSVRAINVCCAALLAALHFENIADVSSSDS